MAQQLAMGRPLGTARPDVIALRSRASLRPARAARVSVVYARDRQAAGRNVAALVSVTAATLATTAPSQAATDLAEVAISSAPSFSVPTVDVDGAIGVAAQVIRAAGSTVQQGLNYAGVGAGYAKQVFDKVAPVVKSAADTAAPYLQSAAAKVSEVAAPALRQAEPTIKGTISEAEKALASNGLDAQNVLNQAKPATDAAKSAIDSATPFVFRAIDFLTHSDVATLTQYGLGAGVIYIFGPGVLRVFFGSFRGYAGDISPAAALDAVASDGNTYLIDLRTSREKESSGSPDLPAGQRLIELEYASMDDRRLRSQLRNVSALELQVTALEVAALKKIGKGSTLLLLDRNGSASKAVAKELTSKGFRKAFVVSGGFNGWTSAKLRTKASSSVSAVEVLPPVFGNLTRAVQKGSTAVSRTVSGQRALPGGR